MGSTTGVPKIANANHGPTVVAMDIYDTSSEQVHRIGTRLVKGERVYFYSKAGSGALTAGLICTGSSYGLATSTPTAHGAGDVVITCSGPSTSVGDYAEGYIFLQNTAVSNNTAEAYKVRANSSSAGGNFTVTLYDGLGMGTSVGTSGVVCSNQYANAITAPTNQSEPPTGTPAVSTSAGYYFWQQTWGPATLVTWTAFAAANAARNIVVSTVSAGSFMVGATAGVQVVGYRYNQDALTAGMGAPVYLTIAR